MEYQNKPGPGASDKATDSAGETHADGSSARAASFVDARPVMARDRQLMQMMRANADTHVDAGKQAAAPPAAAKPVLQPKQMSKPPSSRSPIQLATKVTGAKVGGVASEATHTEGYFSIDPVRQPGVYAEVGTKMTAKLYEKSPLKGSPVGNQWLWMDALKERARTKVIRGHLLNHDLGGKGLPHNLFPISNAANQEHSNQVEQKVKGWLYGDGKKDTAVNPLTYEVEVKNRDDKALKATFHCTWSYDGKKESYDVNSDLNVKTRFSMAGPRDEHGRSIPKVVPPGTWAKGAKEKLEDQKSRDVKVERKDPRFSNGGKLEAGEQMTVHIEGVVEGSAYEAKPYWRRQLENMDFSEKYLDAADAWGKKKSEAGNESVEINDALDIAVGQLDRVQREAPKGIGGKGKLGEKHKKQAARGERKESLRIVIRPDLSERKQTLMGVVDAAGNRRERLAEQKFGRGMAYVEKMRNVRRSIAEEIQKQRSKQEKKYQADIEKAIHMMLGKANEALDNKN